MIRKRKGMTLIEVILAIALLGIISVSLITGFSSQMMNINRGTDITVEAMDAQASFEDLIYDVKDMIQQHDHTEALDPLLGVVPEWSYETVQIQGQDVVMQKLNKSYSDDVKENTVYLSRRLAEIEERNKLPISGVMIGVTTDPNDLLADLTLSPQPQLNAVHDDNTTEPGFYVNLYRWWKSAPGKDISSLTFPDDFSVVNVSLTTDVLTNLLDNVGAGRYVALTVTPVDIHGYRGNTVISSNYVFVKGDEWRIGVFPWADTNNDYNLDGNDVRIGMDRIRENLNAASDLIPNHVDPTDLLSIENSSLFVPMNVDPGGGLTPGELPVVIDGSEIVDWSFENNINLAKDIDVRNGSDVHITAGTDSNGGSVYLYPYIELDTNGDPVTINGAPKIIDYGTSITTTGDIEIKTLSRGNVELYNHNELDGNNILLEARGSITTNNSSLSSDGDIILDTTKNPEISGDRSIIIEETTFASSNPNTRITMDAKSDIVFRGGGWSSNQSLYVPDGKSILFTSGDSRVSNSGTIDVGNTGRIYFEHSMNEDLNRPLRIRLERESDNEFQLRTINYSRNVSYAGSSSSQTVVMPGLWSRLGTGNHNFEFSTRVLSGPGSVGDLTYSYDGNGIIEVDVTSSNETADTRVRLDVRDRFDTSLIGYGYFVYSVDDEGDSTIDVEEPPPLNYYTITFNTNGGTEIPPVSGYAGDAVGSISDPTRVGHRFLGWDKTIPSVIEAYDLEISALWEAIDYEISFDSNGGPTIPSKYYKYGDLVSIPNPSRIGYTFIGWDTLPPDTMPAENLHFVAQWTKNTLTVTFDSNGGTGPDPSSKQVTYDSEYGQLADTERPGYVFDGWYTDPDNGSLIEEDTIVSISNNHTLYAHWSDAHDELQFIQIDPYYRRNSFTLTFNNPISSTIVETNLGKINNYSIDSRDVTYSGNDTDEGDYYVIVKDIYGQEIRIDIRLSRIYFLIFPIGWEWSKI